MNTQSILKTRNLEKVELQLSQIVTSNLIFFLIFTELGSSEESGKDWSDLEAEAAAADKEDFNVSF